MRREALFILAGIGIVYLATCIPRTADASGAGGRAAPTLLSATRVIQLPETYPRNKVPVISGLALLPEANLLAAAGDDHLIRLWNARDGKLVRPLFGHEDWIRAVLFTSGEQLISAGDDGNLFFWKNFRDEKSEKSEESESPDAVPLKNGHPISSAAVSPDGTLLVLGGLPNRLLVLNAKSGKKLRELSAPGNDIRAVAFSPDGRSLAAAGREGRIRVWDMPAGKSRHDLVGHGVRVCDLAYSPDGEWLASAGEEHFVRLWNAKTGEPGPILDRRPGTGSALAFCGPSWLAIGGSDNTIRLWDLKTRSQPFELEGHTGTITRLVWDPASKRLYSASFDTTVRVWSLEQVIGDAASVSRNPSRPERR